MDQIRTKHKNLFVCALTTAYVEIMVFVQRPPSQVWGDQFESLHQSSSPLPMDNARTWLILIADRNWNKKHVHTYEGSMSCIVICAADLFFWTPQYSKITARVVESDRLWTQVPPFTNPLKTILEWVQRRMRDVRHQVVQFRRICEKWKCNQEEPLFPKDS